MTSLKKSSHASSGSSKNIHRSQDVERGHAWDICKGLAAFDPDLQKVESRSCSLLQFDKYL